MPSINRQPAGQPTGGQFAPDVRASAGVSLEASFARTASIHQAQATAQEIAENGSNNPWTRYEPFEEHFPSLDVDAYTADFYEPATRAMAEGREEDAFDLLTIAERLNAREERLAKSGWNTPPAVSKPLPTRPAKFPAVGHIVTGSHYDPDRSAEDIAELITRDLKAARASHAFPPSMGPFVEFDKESNSLNVSVVLDADEALGARASKEDPSTGEVVQSEYARVTERRAREIAHKYVEYGTYIKNRGGPNDRHYPGVKIRVTTEPSPADASEFDQESTIRRAGLSAH